MGKASRMKKERRELVTKAILTISLSDVGQVEVNGPIQDKIFCLGLLELAKVAVLEYNPSAVKILTPDATTVVGLSGKGNN